MSKVWKTTKPGPIEDWETGEIIDMIAFRIPAGEIISIRLNREESDIVRRAAEFHGMKFSTYIKHQALKASALSHMKGDFADECAVA